MGKVSVQNLQVGLKLASPVVDVYGNTLIAQGSELAEKHLRLLKTWGIIEVNIVEPRPADDPLEEKLDPETMKVCQEELTPLFEKANLEYPAMEELFRQSVWFRAKRKVKRTGTPLCK